MDSTHQRAILLGKKVPATFYNIFVDAETTSLA